MTQKLTARAGVNINEGIEEMHKQKLNWKNWIRPCERKYRNYIAQL